MAEFVEKCMEEMVPELRKMEKLKLFSRIELRKIVKNRKSLEYKLRRKTKELNDFLKYIEYESNVLKLLKNRRKAAQCHKMVKEIDVSVIKRIHKLYQLACQRFPENIDLWLKHIDFCNTRNEKSRIIALYNELLKLHPHKSSLWVLAAKHEMEDNSSILNARNLMQKALRLNPDDKYLYLEYFRLELLCAEKIRLRQEVLEIEEDNESSLKNGEIAKVIFKNVKKTFPLDVDLFIEFLRIADIFSFATEVKDDIYEALSTFKYNEMARAVIIMRCFDIKDHAFERVKALGQVISGFQDAIKDFSFGSIYELFLENLLNLSQAHKLYHLVKDTIISIFTEALEKNLITENMALKWVKLPDTSNNNITEKLVEKFPKNVQLISFYLNNQLGSMNIKWICDYVSKYTNEHHNNMNEDVKIIWKNIFDHYLTNFNDLKYIFKAGILSENRYVVEFVKCTYFSIFSLHKNISSIRKLYIKITNTNPFPIDVVFQYLNVEMVQACVDAEQIRRSFENALIWFGNENIDIWLKYIMFERNCNMGKAENIGRIYERAKQYLQPELASEFVEKFTLIN